MIGSGRESIDSLAVCRRTSFCSRGILTPPPEDAVRNRDYGYFSDKLLADNNFAEKDFAVCRIYRRADYTEMGGKR